MERAERLQTVAIEAGATGYGVCHVDPFADTEREIAQRVDAGMSAGMRFTFGDPTTATTIRTTFPWAERIVVVAWSYLPQAGMPGPDRPQTGRIARFATDDHYTDLHRVLAAVATALHAEGFRAEPIADDSRLVDRAAAVRAGVGWWGKNTMVLAPRTGPWFLLGSVVTDAELPPSSPMVRDCGTCDACLPACPTGALVAPGVLDARLCLAYWLQAPGIIPYELRRPMGTRIYGCDDCLDACPPGKRVLAGATSAVGRVDLLDLLSTDDETLLDRYRHWYIPRRDPRFLRRNALVALGNSGGDDAVTVAAGYLGHPDWLLRAHAAWAMGELGGALAAPVLAAAAQAETNADVEREIARAQQVAGTGLR